MDWIQSIINLATILAGVALGSIIGSEIGVRIAVRRFRKILSRYAPEIKRVIELFMGSKSIDMGVIAKIMLGSGQESREEVIEVVRDREVR